MNKNTSESNIIKHLDEGFLTININKSYCNNMDSKAYCESTRDSWVQDILLLVK